MASDLHGEVVVIKRNGADGARFPFRNLQCLFGRNPDCDIRIQLPNVAQEHAKLCVENGKILLKNLCTDVPAKLNNKEFQTEEIQNNDVFTITERSFRFEFPQKRKSCTPRRSSSSKKTPLKALQGSPRTPVVSETLKKSITKLRRTSTVVKEEDENVPSPSPTQSSPQMSTLSPDHEKENAAKDTSLHTTPSILKKKAKVRTAERKRVSFGGDLSPELFDKSLPPSTPLRKGRSPARRLSEPLKQDTPGSVRGKKRYSVGTMLMKMPIMEEEDEDKVTSCVERPSMPMNEIPLHLANLCDTPPQDLEAPLIPPAVEDTLVDTEPNRSAFKKKLSTPLRDSIKRGVSLKSRRQKLATPIRKQLQAGVTLRKTFRKISTPLRQEILGKPKLKATKKKLATPLRKQIEEKSSLRKTKQKISTPLRKEINKGVTLRKTKLKMRESLQKEIQSMPVLKATKKKLATPLKKDIESKPKLNPTMKKMSTPIQNEIKMGHKLKQTHQKMATPLRDSIKSAPKLRQTKKIMSQELQKEIINGAILKKTLKCLPTSLCDEIKQGVTLRATKQKMDKSLQGEILAGKLLNKTKLTMPTPLKRSIEGGKELRKTKRTAPTPFRKQIKEGVRLRATKKKLDAKVQNEIKNGKKLRKTIKAAPTPFRNEIKQGVRLRKTKRKMDVELQNEIQEGKKLRKTLQTAPTPLRKEIKSGMKLRETKRRLSARVQDEIKNGKVLHSVLKKSLKTPIRAQIRSGVRLRQTLKRMSTPLKEEIQNRRKSLRSSSAGKNEKLNPTSSAVIKRPVLKAKRRLAHRSQEMMLNFVPIEKAKPNGKSEKPARKKVCRRSTPKKITALRENNKCPQKLSEDPSDKQADSESCLSLVEPQSIKESAGVGFGLSMNKPGIQLSDDHGSMSPVLILQNKFSVEDNCQTLDMQSESYVSETSVEDITCDLEGVPTFKINQPGEIESFSQEVMDDNELPSDSTAVLSSEKYQRVEGTMVEHHLGLKRLLKTPKDKKLTNMSPVKENLGLEGLLKTPKNCDPTKTVEEGSFCLERLMKTPKDHHSTEVLDNVGLQKLFATPKDLKSTKESQVEENLGLVRLMKTPRDKPEKGSTEIVDNLGLKRLMATPKNRPVEKKAIVEEHLGLKRLMKTPKPVKGTSASPCLDGLIHIMKMPIHKAEEVTENYGLRRLLKTPKSLNDETVNEDIADEVLSKLFESPVKDVADDICDSESSNAIKAPSASMSDMEQPGIRQTRSNCGKRNATVHKPVLSSIPSSDEENCQLLEDKNAEAETKIEHNPVIRRPRTRNGPTTEQNADKRVSRRGRPRKQLTNVNTVVPSNNRTEVKETAHQECSGLELQNTKQESIVDPSTDITNPTAQCTMDTCVEQDLFVTKSKLNALETSKQVPTVCTEENVKKPAARMTRRTRQSEPLSSGFNTDDDTESVGMTTRRSQRAKRSHDTTIIQYRFKKQKDTNIVDEEITETQQDIDMLEQLVSTASTSADSHEGNKSESLTVVDNIEMTKLPTRSTRSTKRKSIEQIVQKITLQCQPQEEKTSKAVKEKMGEPTTVQQFACNTRRGKRKCITDHENPNKPISEVSAGKTEGIVATPPKLKIQKAKLKAIPEESEKDLETPTVTKRSNRVKTNKRLAPDNNIVEDEINIKVSKRTSSRSSKPTRRSTRGNPESSDTEQTATTDNSAAVASFVQSMSVKSSSTKRKRETGCQETELVQPTKRSKQAVKKRSSPEPAAMRITRSRKTSTK